METAYGATTEEIDLSRHPCLGAAAHHKFGRIHLPVSPACNIGCRFCRRAFNATEQRPGVAAGILTPEEALAKVGEALLLCPEITVVGIAGPGDTLATEHALQTFSLVHEKYPHLIKCLSTNGLLLPRYIDRLAQAGVRTVTVTVNAVLPEIEARINAFALLDGICYTGTEAAEILIEAQLEGIARAAGLGVTVKVNTVLIPGVNSAHIGEIARTVKEAGAKMYNIIPLIPEHAFKEIPEPTCRELYEARAAAEKHIDVFRHCKHCRADACGIPGREDFASRLYQNRQAETFSHG